jgi:hypothetical protein
MVSSNLLIVISSLLASQKKGRPKTTRKTRISRSFETFANKLFILLNSPINLSGIQGIFAAVKKESFLPFRRKLEDIFHFEVSFGCCYT